MGYDFNDLVRGNFDIEEIYSILDIIVSGLWFRDRNEMLNSLGKRFWNELPDAFLKSYIMEIINPPSIEALKKSCIYHDIVFKELKFGDAIISFNYDLIAEASLLITKKWSEFNGYGFYCPEILFNEEIYDIDKSISKLNPNQIEENFSDILLLKPHGSINWRTISRPRKDIFSLSIPTEKKPEQIIKQSFHEELLDVNVSELKRITINPFAKILKKEIAYDNILPIESINFWDDMYLKANFFGKAMIKHDAYKIARKEFNTFIIPPTIYKFTSLQPYEIINVWSKIKIALSNAKRILCIGYAFREADLQFNTLFRLAIKNNENRNLKIGIIDPKKDDIKRKLEKFFNKKLEIKLLGEKLSEVPNINLKSFFNE